MDRSGSRLGQKLLPIDEELRRRIELSRVILIIAIVFHHIRMPAELSLFTWDNLGYLRGYLQIGVLKTATSTLTVISGYLLFRSSFERDRMDTARKKFHTLFVPLLLWNIPIAVALFLYQRNGHYILKYDDLSQGNILNWANALLGLTREPANGPLHFLRNIIGCNIIALLIGGVFRRYALAIFAVIVVVGVLDLGRSLVTRNDILIGFFLGGLAATAVADFKSIDFLLPVSGPCFLVSAFLIYYLEVSYDSVWWLLHRFLAFLAAWPLIGYLNNTGLGRKLAGQSKYMFFIFLSHYYVILLSFAVFGKLFSLDYFFIYFLIAGPLAIAIAVAAYSAARRLLPGPLKIATGGRS